MKDGDPFDAKFSGWNGGTPLKLAVRQGHPVPLVEELAKHDERSLRDLNLIYYCVDGTYGETNEQAERRIPILQFIVNQIEHLITMASFNGQEHYLHSGPIVADRVHLKLIKFLIENGADLEATYKKETVLLRASQYMTGEDFHELCRCLINDRNAVKLFCPFESSSGYPKWKNPLHFLLENGKALSGKTLQLILGTPGIDVNVLGDVPENTLLLSAVKFQRSLDIITALVSNGADINYKNGNGQSALHLAAKTGNVKVAKYLLSLGLPVNELDVCGATPLSYSQEHVGMIKCLIAAGADVFVKDQFGNTIVHQVARFSSEFDFHDTTAFLLEQDENKSGSVFTVKNDGGRAPLHERLHYDGKVEPETLTLLLNSKHVNVNDQDDSGNALLLLSLSRKENVALARVLIKLGADCKLKNRTGTSVVHLAAQQNDLDLLKYFVAQGLSVKNADIWRNASLLYAYPTVEMVKYLVSQGDNICAINEYGGTVVHNAARWLTKEEFHELVMIMAPGACTGRHILGKRNNFGETALSCRLESKDIDIKTLEALLKFQTLQHNAKDGKLDDEWNELFLSAVKTHQCLDVLKRLVECGADVNACNSLKQNALHLALESAISVTVALPYLPPHYINPKLLETVGNLLSLGVNSEHRDSQRRTPLGLALWYDEYKSLLSAPDVALFNETVELLQNIK